MAIDDNTNYTLTGAQVKDLAARIKAGSGGMTVYVNASFANPSLITSVFSDSALTTPADPEDMADVISAGGAVAVVYDGGQSQELIELSSVNSNSRFPEVGHTFTSTISTSAVFSAPTVVTLLYDDYYGNWSVETTAVSTVNDATLTIQKNGTDVQTFTANQSTNATANIIVPTQFSDLSGTVDADQIDNRLFRMLIPEGTEITSNKNLNTTEFLRVGKYYCPGNSIVVTLTNCPTSSAFMMEVFSPLSTTIDNETTGTWVYRVRIITTFTGLQFIQSASSGSTAGSFTYGAWNQILAGTVGTSQIDNSAVTEAKIAAAFKNKLFYNSGDVITMSDTSGGPSLALTGGLTTGNKDFYVSVPVAKMLTNITSATVNSMTGYARAHGAYLTNMQGGNAVSQASTTTARVNKLSNTIDIIFNRSSGWGATNNAAVSFQVTAFKITLS